MRMEHLWATGWRGLGDEEGSSLEQWAACQGLTQKPCVRRGYEQSEAPWR